ncbi:MAG: type II toxin-antitoxin system RelE/ParE family toxin [Fidelibacterota bacterium]|nr:MAG: type II toxin-antitoxin system RelE/ParE family toxin [Candidatus Neomarinimicrobiota bacterium]
MKHDIILAPEAVEDLREFSARNRAIIKSAIEKYLRYEPAKVSRSRIKRLRGISRPQFRLRVGSEIRVFYDLTEQRVEILAIVMKSNTADWLEKMGEIA